MSAEHYKAATHPDENRLAAFAERALHGAECQAVVAHLADCSRCREIVFLAREAEEGSETARNEVARPISVRRRWQVAMATAAVVVLAGAVLLIRQGRLSVPASHHEIAANVTPRDKGPNPYPPAEKASPVSKPGSTRHESGTATNSELVAGNRQKRVASKQATTSESALLSHAAPPSSNEQAARSNAALNTAGALPLQTRAVSPPSPPVPLVSPAPSLALQAGSPSAASEQVTITAETKMSVRKVSSDEAIARSLLPPGASAPQFVVMKGEVRRWDANGLQVLRLPNGTKAKAVASGANIVLVLSQSRELYRSVDLGEHWTEVSAQWQGKAQTLQARLAIPRQTSASIQGFSGGSGGGVGGAAQAVPPPSAPTTAANNSSAPPAALKAASPAGGPTPANLTFVLTNSVGRQWISHDGGQTWLSE